MTHSNFDVMGIGTVGVDHQVFLPHQPVPNTKLDFTADRFQIGGPVPTGLVFLQRLGLNCTFLAAWGDDHYGDQIEMDFQREQLDFHSAIRRPGVRSGYSHVWIDESSGDRTIACYRCQTPLRPGELKSSALPSARALHLDGWPEDTALAAARMMKHQGGIVFLDAGNRKPSMEQLLPLVDVLNCPARFLEQMFPGEFQESSIAKLLAFGPRMISVTFGEQGAGLWTREESIRLGALPGPVADTNGAGDVYCGGLIYGVLQNWQPEQILRFAIASGSLKCRARGNREALPDRATVIKHLPRVPSSDGTQ